MIAQLIPLAVLSALTSPTAIAAVLVILNRPRPVALLAGYAIGSFSMSVVLGLAIVLLLEDSGAFSPRTSTENATVDIAAGVIVLAGAAWLDSSLSAAWRSRVATWHAERRARRAGHEGRLARALRRGSVGLVAGLGAAMHLPGLLYLVALAEIAHAKPSAAAALIVLVLFNLVMLSPIGLPLFASIRDPAWTRSAIERIDRFGRRHRRVLLLATAVVVGGYLVLTGLARLL